MLEKTDLTTIFKTIGREAKKNGLTAIGLGFSGFKEALFRIVVKAKDLLNDIAKKKKSASKLQNRSKH